MQDWKGFDHRQLLGQVKPNPFNKGQVNHVTVEEEEEQPDAVVGKFLVKTFTAIVLLDRKSVV